MLERSKLEAGDVNPSSDQKDTPKEDSKYNENLESKLHRDFEMIDNETYVDLPETE